MSEEQQEVSEVVANRTTAMDRNTVDHHKYIARSYLDAFHDDERNHAYDLAIRASVNHLVASQELNPDRKRFFRCCDIGTASGLFSMMIARAFRALDYTHFYVTTFEASEPMAECAKKVVEANGMSDCITVLPTRLEDYQNRSQFDLLVAELLSTKLLAEGRLETYRHAVQKLCSPNCIFIPQEARVYVQPICSEYLFSRHAIGGLNWKRRSGPTVDIQVPDEVKNCCGVPKMDDVQLNGVDDITEIAGPEMVFSFKFGDLEPLNSCDYNELDFELEKEISSSPMLVMWWDIVMYDAALYQKYINPKDITTESSFSKLSCAPGWIRRTKVYPGHNCEKGDELIKELYGRDVWRKSWIPGICHFASVQKTRQLEGLKADASLTVYAYHDSHSIWFDLKPPKSTHLPTCSCGVHRSMSRHELSFLNNDEDHFKIFLYSNKIPETSLYGRIGFADFRASKINGESFDRPKWTIYLWTYYLDPIQVNLVDLSLQDEVNWRKILNLHLDGSSILPIKSFNIKCSQVLFNNLGRIREKVGTCEGFDLSQLDQMIENSSKYVDMSAEPHCLWGYDSHCIGPNVVIYSSDNDSDRNKLSAGVLEQRFHVAPFMERGRALVFWCELKLGNGYLVSTGPKGLRENGIRWNRNFMQLVHFLQDTPRDGEIISELEIRVELSRQGLRVTR